MTATILPIVVEQGATWEVRCQIYESDGATPRSDLAGWSGAMQIRPSADSDTVLGEADVTINGSTGVVTATLPADDTAGYDWVTGVYDLIIDNGAGRVERILQGTARLSRAVTE